MKAGIGSRISAVAIAVVTVLACASSALANTPTVFGPVYPLPGYTTAHSHGGSSCVQTGAINTGDLVWSFGSNPSTTAPEAGSSCADAATPPAFDPSRNQALYWGLDLTSPGNNQVSVGPDIGPTTPPFPHQECPIPDTVSGPMTYDSADSTPLSGVIKYQGTGDGADILTLTFKDQNGMPVALTDATTIGSFHNGSVSGSALGFVIAVTPSVTKFSVSASYTVHGQPLTFYNPNCGTTSDISGGFYYVDLPPSATIGASPSPVANHTTTTFSAASPTDPYAADDGNPGLTYAWDLSGGMSYMDGTNSSIQSSYGPGSHTVALLVTAPDGLSSREELPFTITNQPPTGTITASPNPPKSLQLATFQATNVTDPDRGNDGKCAAPTYAWDLSGGTNYSQFPNANATGKFGAGKHTIALGITDCDLTTARVIYTFTIPPIAKVAIKPKQTLATARSNGIQATFNGNEAFTSQLALTVAKATSKAGKPLDIDGTVGTAKPSLTKAGSVPFTISLTSTAKTQLSNAKSATFALKGSAKDKAGHTVPISVSFTLS